MINIDEIYGLYTTDERFDFVAIDFETATHNFNSACAIGLAAVRDGEIVETEYSLIKPPELKFSPENIKIHGITPDMVADSPTLDDLWLPVLKKYFSDETYIVAHNARFDISVLKKSLSYYDCPDFKYIDSISVARDFVPGNKSLERCAEYLGIDMGQHHNALDDAITCAKIVLKCLNMSGLTNIEQLLFPEIQPAQKKTRLSSLSRNQMKDKYDYSSYISAKDIKPNTETFDETHPFYQKNLVFTGMPPLGRNEAMQAVADLGAILKDDISRKIDYLVVGEPDPKYSDQFGKSRKERKAIELNQSGKANIKIITGEEFLKLLNEKPVQDENNLSLYKPTQSESDNIFKSKIFPALQNAVSQKGGPTEELSYKRLKDKAKITVSLKNITVFWLRIGKKVRYIEIPTSSNTTAKLLLDDAHQLESYTDELIKRVEDVCDQFPKEFDCCSRFEKCSDEKHCIHPDKSFALGCGYRKILNSGRIFYGKNRNIE